ncbi:MAG: proline--tRNA ligase [Actinobacteria bacterium]|nr:proline--tRNA ligase [Actinomycetota bacterium]MBT3688474.1 proline--tRNA ligase [Actinomycetota bacterium]MBT4036730.1 proline--tRNA ligase [Actinomycetota bacterium]MBT4278888.1 proline--tRNA ligase [Actinomycetota bacterium]MBT4342937.1 proline--tRNA ligase [Actinomycetota bacterium]
MRWSNLFIPTLREAPAEADAVNHRLLVRGGFIRQLQSGHYSMLPLGWRVHQKVGEVIRQEMDAIGGQEFLLPAMHQASLWQKSGRWDSMGDEMFRLTDRKGADLALGMTHEEVFATLSLELASYRDLPQIWYQIQWKFRDEPRPKAGLLRVREFAMKDSYSFDIDDEGLDSSFDMHHGAYQAIFSRLDLDAVPVQASSGAMGGSASVEFMVASPAGEDDVVQCGGCDYAANVERATAALEPIQNRVGSDAPESIPTPDIRTIKALSDAGHPPEHQIKTLVYRIDGSLVLILLRGDHAFLEQKFVDATGAIDLVPAEADEIRAALGASPGSLGAVGVTDLTIYADPALEGRSGMTTGANEDDVHLTGVDIARDIAVDRWLDMRGIEAGEPCASCGEALTITRCIEAGHIFKLGRKYSEAMGVSVLDAEGENRVPTMGSYGIGVGRAMAAIVETHHDDAGMIWPMCVAPFEVVLTVVKVDHEGSMAVAEAAHGELLAAGIDVLLDDRDGRPGVKFADSELIGIPLRVTIGPRGIDSGMLELTMRATGEQQDLPVGDLVTRVVELVHEGRSARL